MKVTTQTSISISEGSFLVGLSLKLRDHFQQSYFNTFQVQKITLKNKKIAQLEIFLKIRLIGRVNRDLNSQKRIRILLSLLKTGKIFESFKSESGIPCITSYY